MPSPPIPTDRNRQDTPHASVNGRCSLLAKSPSADGLSARSTTDREAVCRRRQSTQSRTPPTECTRQGGPHGSLTESHTSQSSSPHSTSMNVLCLSMWSLVAERRPADALSAGRQSQTEKPSADHPLAAPRDHQTDTQQDKGVQQFNTKPP